MCAHGVNGRVARDFCGRRRRPALGNDSAQICRYGTRDRAIGTRLAPPTRRSGAHRQAVRGERFFQDPERSRSKAVEAEQFGLASVRDVRQPGDTDRSERPRRWRSDLGKIIVRHVLMLAGRPPVACSKSTEPAFGDTDMGQASDVVRRSGTQDLARSAARCYRCRA
jgi:hypothetical protein